MGVVGRILKTLSYDGRSSLVVTIPGSREGIEKYGDKALWVIGPDGIKYLGRVYR
ncbi:MAG: hypothetical protein J7K98_02810 [Candidatus Aenigmarchaeota archaeon]|nr:hypothetical protein [Candidatus Aenigmarchaeota archaeon]